MNHANSNPPAGRAVADALRTTLAAQNVDKPEQDICTLVLLSGGIDSVAVLANVLSETRHRVHAHHIELANRENRDRAENDAVADIVDFCWSHYRDFEYSSSKSEFRVAPRGYDLIVTMFHAGMVCLASRVRPTYVMTGHFHTSRLRAAYGDRMLGSCFATVPTAPRWVRPLDALPDRKTTKIDIYRSVPPELADLSWSCRTPVPTDTGFVPCGKCYACKNLEAARSAAYA